MQRTARQMFQIATLEGITLFDSAISHVEQQAKQGALSTRYRIAGSSSPAEIRRLTRDLEQQGYLISRIQSDSIDIAWSREAIADAERRDLKRAIAPPVFAVALGIATCSLIVWWVEHGHHF